MAGHRKDADTGKEDVLARQSIPDIVHKRYCSHPFIETKGGRGVIYMRIFYSLVQYETLWFMFV